MARRDSAGVEIVENRGPVWASDEGWSLGPEPVLEIGTVAGAPEEQLWRVAGVTRLSDGRLAVLNAGTHELRFYGPDGEILGAAGREGGGPGEFDGPVSLAGAPGDTLVVLDRGGDRVVFTSRGELVRQESLRLGLEEDEETGDRWWFVPHRILPDRSVVGSRRPLGAGDAPLSTPYRPETGIRRVGDQGRVLADFGTHPGILQERVDVGGPVPMSVVPPFAPGYEVGVGGRPLRVVVGDTERYELRVFDDAGRLRRIVRRRVEPEPVRPGEVEAWKDRQRQAEWVQGQLPELERAWTRITIPGTRPFFGRIVVARTGHLWVGEYVSHPGSPSYFSVFEPDGRYLGDVPVPRGLGSCPGCLEIGPDYVLGVWQDERGVEYVRMYGLWKG